MDMHLNVRISSDIFLRTFCMAPPQNPMKTAITMMTIQEKRMTYKSHDKNDSKLMSLSAQTKPQTAGMQIARLSFFSLTTITNKAVINNT